MQNKSFGLIERFRTYLPVSDKTPVVTLGEGSTPLIPLLNIPKTLSVDLNWYVKFEGLNPTCSFKDRGMTMAVSKAKESGSNAIMCASTGNTSAAAAAYAARAGMKCFVIIPEGNIALGKLAQAMIHGATVLQIKGNFDEGMKMVKSLTKELAITLVNSINPFRLEGQKTIAFEIIETLNQAPDFHYLPVGNAGNISASWMGYEEYFKLGKVKNKPTMVGIQASGAAPFLKGGPIENPQTIATAIKIGNPQSWDKAQSTIKASKGWFQDITDSNILAAQKLLASQEGVFCEPASAASIAGVLHDVQLGKIPSGSTVVCTLTGHGLKDPNIAIEQCKDSLITVEGGYQSIKDLLEQRLKL